MSIMYCLHAIQSAIHIIRYSNATVDIVLNEPLLTEHTQYLLPMLYKAGVCYIIVFFCTYAQMFTCTSAQQNEYIARDSRSLTHILYG